jgi:hypothetical protein
MPSLLDPDEDQTLGQTGAGLLRIGQDDGSDRGAALADLYRRVTEPQPQGDVTPRWDADNPVGTETTQTLRQATPILPGTLQAHQQVQQAMELAPTVALGMVGDAPGKGISLERVGEWPGATGSLKHSYLMKDPAGQYIGSVDTTYHPGAKDLRIEDVRADEGAGSLGTQAILGMRALLRRLYPDAETLSGNRISGANPEREAAQGFPPPAATQRRNGT